MDPSKDEFKTLHGGSIPNVMLFEKYADPDLLLLVTLQRRSLTPTSRDNLPEEFNSIEQTQYTNRLSISLQRVRENDTSGIFEDVLVKTIDLLESDRCKSVQRLNRTHLIVFGMEFALVIRVRESSIDLLHKLVHFPDTNRIYSIDSSRFAMQLGNSIYVYNSHKYSIIKVIRSSNNLAVHSSQEGEEGEGEVEGRNSNDDHMTLKGTLAKNLIVYYKGDIVLLNPYSSTIERVLIRWDQQIKAASMASSSNNSNRTNAASSLHYSNYYGSNPYTLTSKYLILSKGEFAARIHSFDKTNMINVYSLLNQRPSSQSKPQENRIDSVNSTISAASCWTAVIPNSRRVLQCESFKHQGTDYMFVVTMGELLQTQCRFYRILHEQSNNGERRQHRQLQQSEIYTFNESNFYSAKCLSFHTKEVYFVIIFESYNTYQEQQQQIYINKLFSR